jgi:hypothetical protein
MFLQIDTENMTTSLIPMAGRTTRVQREIATRPLEFLGGLLNSHLFPITKLSLIKQHMCMSGCATPRRFKLKSRVGLAQY